MTRRRCDVEVVGAGLAGLACANHLSDAGLDVLVLEGSDAVGGRARTDRIDGFLVERGFQVLNTAYPEVRRVLDLDALDLRLFDRAMLLHVDGSSVRLPDPRREPIAALGVLGAPIGGLRDKAALSTYAALMATVPATTLKGRPDVTARTAWRGYGLSDEVVDRVLRPFFAGVLLESEMSTSSRFTNLMMRMFVRGRNALPARGMQAMGEQLAARLPTDSLYLDSPVRAVSASAVQSIDGPVAARAVVVATDARAAAGLLPGLVVEPSWKGSVTLYHVAASAPSEQATLLVDADDSPVNNTTVLTAAAPEHSSDGRALIATALVPGIGGRDLDESAVRRRLGALYRTSTTAWDLVATYDVPRALPSMSAPYAFRKPVRLRQGDETVYVCGDHRDTSSIQGALVSGRRAATAVLTDLGISPDAGLAQRTEATP